MSEKLTDKQQIFKEIFVRAVMDDRLPKREAIKLARQAACYAESTAITHILTPALTSSILEEINLRLALTAAEAVASLEDVLAEPERKGAANVIAAANSLLDRSGITKKETQEVNLKVPSAVIILPPKVALGPESTD